MSDDRYVPACEYVVPDDSSIEHRCRSNNISLCINDAHMFLGFETKHRYEGATVNHTAWEASVL